MRRITTLSVLFGVAAAFCGAMVHAQNVPQRQASITVQLQRHTNAKSPPVITAVAIHPDGKTAAMAGDDHVVRLLNLSTGEVKQHLVGHADWIRALCYSPDGGALASAGDDRTIMVWDATGTTEPRALARHPRPIYALRFSRDGKTLASAGFEDKLRLYDPHRGELIRVLDAPCADMRALGFCGAGRLAAGGRNGSLRVWEVATGRVVWEREAHQRRIRAIAISADGLRLVTAGEDRVLRIWDADRGEESTTIDHGGSKVLAATYCGHHRIAGAGTDNIIHIWDAKSGRKIIELTGHTGSVAALAYDKATDTLISGSYDTTVRIWKLGKLLSDRQAIRPAAPSSR
jgi:WD40 repeat protein